MLNMFELFLCFVQLTCFAVPLLGYDYSTEKDSRKLIKVGVVLNRSFGWIKVLKKFTREITDEANDYYEFLKYYKLKSVPFNISEDAKSLMPSEIVNMLCNEFVKERVAAILFLISDVRTRESMVPVLYFMHLNSYTGIPIVSALIDNSGIVLNNDFDKYRVLQMAPTVENEINVLLQIMLRYNWKKFATVTSVRDNDYFSVKCRDFIRENRHSLELINEFAINIENVTDLEESLKVMEQSEARIFLLHSDTIFASTIFRYAAQHSLTDAKHMWLVTHSVVPIKNPLAYVKESLNFPTGIMASYFERVLDMDYDDNAKDSLLAQQTTNLLKVFKHGLDSILNSYNYSIDFESTANCHSDYNYTWPLGDEFYQHLKKVDIKDGVSLVKGQAKMNIQFSDLGYLKETHLSIINLNEEKVWEKIGDYENGKLNIRDIVWPGGKHTPPQGLPEKYIVTVVFLEEPPFIIINDMDPTTQSCPTKQGVQCAWSNKDGQRNIETNDDFHRNNTAKKCCSGYGIDLLKKLGDDLGFDFELYRVADEMWGAKQNKTWNGLVADLVQKKADMCVTALKINSERENDIDFSVPFLETGIAILIAFRGGALSPTAFLEPFEYISWLFILVVSVQAAAAAIFLFEWLSPQSFDRKTKPPYGHKFSLFRSYWLVWATLFSSSVNTDVPRSYVSRFMALVWAAFSLTFIAVYTANLAACMITPTEFYRLTGINDPLIVDPSQRSPPFRYGTVVSGNTEITLRNNYHKLYDYLKSHNYFTANVSDGIKALKRGDYDAFVYDAVVLQYLSGIDDKCEIGTIGSWFSWTGYGIGFQKKSKWLNRVNEKILKYQNAGDLERLRNFWFTGACSPNMRDQKTHSDSLGIENFVSAFVLLSAGILICLVILLLEFLYCNYLRTTLAKCNKSGWCGLISLSLGRSMTIEEAAKIVHKDFKTGKAHNVWFRAKREKYLESELQNAMSELFELRKRHESLASEFAEKEDMLTDTEQNINVFSDETLI